MATGRSSKTIDTDAIKSDRINGEGSAIGFATANPVMCMTCLNANGEPPWADKPTKSYCLAFPRAEGLRKPPSVYYDGKPCEFHRPRR